MYLVMNIGCMECEVSSNVVGIFTDKETAVSVANKCQEKYNWRESGDNDFVVFDMPSNLNVINEEYDIGKD